MQALHRMVTDTMRKLRPYRQVLLSLGVVFLLRSWWVNLTTSFAVPPNTMESGPTQRQPAYRSADDPISRRIDTEIPDLHVLVTTGCSQLQHWQSYVFFYNAWKAGQQGIITRIASGCNETEALRIRERHRHEIRQMSTRFRLHLTPEYGYLVEGEHYPYFNKAKGLEHFLRYGLRFEENLERYKNTVFIPLDPDQFILRPFVRDFSNLTELWIDPEGSRTVSKGHPIAQKAWLGDSITHAFNMTFLLNSTEDSPARHLTEEVIQKHFVAGPPYMAVGEDFWPFVKLWSNFVLPMHELSNKDHISEMLAAVAAAAHLDIPFSLAQSFGVSFHGHDGVEGNELVDVVDDVCDLSPNLDVPHTLHLAQQYYLGPYFFFKYWIPDDILSCDHPLLAEPPPHAHTLFEDSDTFDGEHHDLEPHHRKRMAFILCQSIRRINEAVIYYKQQHCDFTANYKKTFMFLGRDLPDYNAYLAGLSGERENDPSHEEFAQSERQEVETEYVPQSPVADTNIHVIVTTGCSPLQNWQSYMFFHNAWNAQQLGNITRIASGCNETQALEVEANHREHVQSMSENFRIHLTPDFSHIVEGEQYPYFNKAKGIEHFLTHGLRIEENMHVYRDTVFVPLDPDQFILRPFVRDYTRLPELWFAANDDSPPMVEKGHVIFQAAYLGENFERQINMTFLLNSTEDSPARHLSPEVISNHYLAGPPYMAVGSDFWPLVQSWSQFLVPMHVWSNKDHLSEMFAVVTAAAHLGMRPKLGRSFGVSWHGMDGAEGWELVDEIEDVCDLNPLNAVPHTIHFAQEYFLGPYYFFKYLLPNDILTCEHPLLVEPPPDAHLVYTSGSMADGSTPELSEKHRKRMNFMICQLSRRINEAAIYFKRKHCPPSANFSKDFSFGRSIPPH